MSLVFTIASPKQSPDGTNPRQEASLKEIIMCVFFSQLWMTVRHTEAHGTVLAQVCQPQVNSTEMKERESKDSAC